MSKYDEQFKLKVVKHYLAGQGSIQRVAQHHDLDYAMVRRWVCAYRLHGRKGLRKKSTHYSAQFKLSVLQYMWQSLTRPWQNWGARIDQCSIPIKAGNIKCRLTGDS